MSQGALFSIDGLMLPITHKFEELGQEQSGTSFRCSLKIMEKTLRHLILFNRVEKKPQNGLITCYARWAISHLIKMHCDSKY